jgi:hypothetical protein
MAHPWSNSNGPPKTAHSSRVSGKMPSMAIKAKGKKP